MNRISWYNATTISEAQKEADATVSTVMDSQSGSIIKSGGIEVMDLMKEGLINPEKIVNVRTIPGLDIIEFNKKTGMRIGANVLLAEVEKSPEIRDKYPVLQMAVSKAATPQLRNMSTLGGNLAQRTRCWYFRSIDHPCFRKGGSTCYAQNGENDYHAIMNNGGCASVHASSVATALMVLDAQVEIVDAKGSTKTVSIDKFFVTPYENIKTENILKPGEIITAIIIPNESARLKTSYIKQGARQSYDWALADVAVALEMSGGKVKSARIALGAASPVPMRIADAEEILAGNNISESLAAKAAEVAMERATPLKKNGYKVPIFKAIIKRAILKTV
ncbi:MAG: FAD binding domain-containing protein [Cyclobacteriaceae bacterium]